MSPGQVVRFALAGLAANKLRSALTTLGILIGVGSVILLVAVGNGSSQSVQNAISSLGANAITVLHTEGSAGPEAALRVTGLAERMQFQPNQLSGGQQQRVAVSRALVTAPSLVLADEPTGNLDTKASQELMEVFDRLNAAGRTIVLITHEADVAAHAKRVIGFQDGHIVADRRVAEPDALPPLAGQPDRESVPP